MPNLKRYYNCCSIQKPYKVHTTFSTSSLSIDTQIMVVGEKPISQPFFCATCKLMHGD